MLIKFGLQMSPIFRVLIILWHCVQVSHARAQL